MSARTLAPVALWNLPLLKLDVGKIFDSYLGSSEKNIREAINIAEALSPNVLWLDEIDKAFSGVGGTNSGDSDAPVFVLATANNIEHLPPELLRKGRFDDIFFIDLPNSTERCKIFEIHLTKRKRDSRGFDIAQYAHQTEGFTGSEIEQLIISGLYRAFAENREIIDQDILAEIKETVPLSVTYKEFIADLRAWAEGRARSAS